MANPNPPSSVASTSPSWQYAAVTPSNTVDYDIARALYVGSSGDVAAVSHDGDVVTFAGVTAGTILPIVTKRVNATGTTAGSIVALS